MRTPTRVQTSGYQATARRRAHVFFSSAFDFTKNKTKQDFSYSSRTQNGLGVPGSFPVQKQVMRARLDYLSTEFQRGPVSRVSGRVTRILPRDSVKGFPSTIHTCFQTAHERVKGCSQRWKDTHVQGLLVLSEQPSVSGAHVPRAPGAVWAHTPCPPWKGLPPVFKEHFFHTTLEF